MLEIGLAVLYVLFLWWFSTGLIVYLDGLPRQTHHSTFLTASIVAGTALIGLVYASSSTSHFAALLSFSCGLLLWAWQELSYFTGFITGTRKHSCHEECRGWSHFMHAIQVNLYHELAIIIGAIAIVTLTWDAANQVGTWTYLLLWWMQLSAKLNVFLGVRNVSEEFLPEHMFYLKSFLKQKKMNVLFPFSITILTILCVYLVHQGLFANAGSFMALKYFLLAAIVFLAVVEHWLLVLPVSPTALWNWWLNLRDKRDPDSDDYENSLLSMGSAPFPHQALATAGTDQAIKTSHHHSRKAELIRGMGNGDY